MLYSNFKPLKELYKVLLIISIPVLIIYISWIVFFTFKNLYDYSKWDLSNEQNLNSVLLSRLINLLPDYNIIKKSKFNLVKIKTKNENIYPLLINEYDWNAKYRKISISFKDINYKAKIKPKGESPFHFIQQDLSVKIKVPKNNLFENRHRVFDLDKISHPAVFNDVLAYELAKELDLLIPEYKLVYVEFNEQKKFLRQFVGSLDEQLLRLNSKMPADIFTIKLTGKNRDNSFIKGTDGFSSTLPWKKDSVNNHFNDLSKEPIRILLNAYHKVVNNNADINELVKLFDVKYLSRFLFFIQLTQSNHQDSLHNFSLFYDPWMQKFYPVVNDIMAWHGPFGNTLRQQIPKSNIDIKDYLSNTSTNNKLLDLLKKTDLVKQNINELLNNSITIKEKVVSRFTKYHKLAKEDAAFNGIYFIGSRISSRADVIESLNILESYVNKSFKYIDSYSKFNNNNKIILKKKIILKDKLVFNNSKDFSDTEVQIKPGTTIFLGHNVNLIFSEVKMLGNKKYPILINRLHQNKPFGAVVVKQSRNALLRFVEFSGGSGYKSKYYEYTGQFSAHNVENLIIKNCKFSKNSIYDDNVHLVYIKNFFIDETIVENSLFDGVDIDISKGLINNSLFINNGNDGLDLMTSDVVVNNSSFIKNKDKGISVGENSYLDIKNSKIEKNLIGIEVKDKSLAFLNSSINFKLNSKNDINLKKKNYRFGAGGTIKIPITFVNIDINKDKFSNMEYYK